MSLIGSTRDWAAEGIDPSNHMSENEWRVQPDPRVAPPPPRPAPMGEEVYTPPRWGRQRTQDAVEILRNRYRRVEEVANEKEIFWQTREIFTINGEEYASVVMYADSKVYWTTPKGSGTQIISASFTGWSPKQNVLYVKDIRKQWVGGIGLILKVADINIPRQIVEEYNRTVRGEQGASPKAEGLDEMFKLEE
jgi:hypothetical protein